MSEQVRATTDRLSQAIAILEQERARISGAKKFTGKECETCGVADALPAPHHQ